MLEISSVAEFWDCEIEHAEAKKRWVNEHLLYIICMNAGRWNLRKLEVEKALRNMAIEQAVQTQWEIGDRLLYFTDGSRLGLAAIDANTMAGSSRVMASRRSQPQKQDSRQPAIRAWNHPNGMVLDPQREKLWEIRIGMGIYEFTLVPKDGVWVRRFCPGNCGSKAVWTERVGDGTAMPYCADCGAGATYGVGRYHRYRLSARTANLDR